MSDEPKNFSAETEPTATRSTVPMWIVVFTLLLIFVGFVFYDRHSGWFSAKVYAPYGTAEQVEAYQPQSGAGAAMARGKKVFEMYCGACHGNDGAGKPGQAPPLAGSEFVNAKGDHRITMIPLEGLAGPIHVKNADWNLNMAPMGAGLSDADLAAVLTYIRGSWGNKADEVPADDVKKIRAEVTGKPAINGNDLKNLPE